jgi:hypothetical protein
MQCFPVCTYVRYVDNVSCSFYQSPQNYKTLFSEEPAPTQLFLPSELFHENDIRNDHSEKGQLELPVMNRVCFVMEVTG